MASNPFQRRYQSFDVVDILEKTVSAYTSSPTLKARIIERTILIVSQAHAVQTGQIEDAIIAWLDEVAQQEIQARCENLAAHSCEMNVKSVLEGETNETKAG
jgi:hypothetical protein